MQWSTSFNSKSEIDNSIIEQHAESYRKIRNTFRYLLGNLNDNFDISYGTFTVNAASGNTKTLGTLGVSGAVDLDSTLDVEGATRLASTLDVSGATVIDGTVDINNDFELLQLNAGLPD